jgi:hypothetical protein
MEKKPNIITAKVDFTNLIPESDENNNNCTISVLLGVTISGSIYKKENNEIIPYEEIIELSQYDEDSLSDFGYRHYRSNEKGQYNMSLYPKEPLDESHTYDVMACITNMSMRMIKKSYSVKVGENTTLDFIIDGLPPNKPNTPFGRRSGKINRTYKFYTSVTDPDGDYVYYKFRWGDGTYSNWFGPYDSNEKVSVSNTWDKPGIYSIAVVCKDSNGMLSRWSDPLKITMPKPKPYNNNLFQNFLKNHLHLIQMLRHLLKL